MDNNNNGLIKITRKLMNLQLITIKKRILKTNYGLFIFLLTIAIIQQLLHQMSTINTTILDVLVLVLLFHLRFYLVTLLRNTATAQHQLLLLLLPQAPPLLLLNANSSRPIITSPFVTATCSSNRSTREMKTRITSL